MSLYCMSLRDTTGHILDVKREFKLTADTVSSDVFWLNLFFMTHKQELLEKTWFLLVGRAKQHRDHYQILGSSWKV